MNADLKHKKQRLLAKVKELIDFESSNEASLRKNLDFYQSSLNELCRQKPALTTLFQMRSHIEAVDREISDVQHETEQAFQQVKEIEEEERRQLEKAEKYQYLLGQLRDSEACNEERRKHVEELEARMANENEGDQEAEEPEEEESAPNSEEIDYNPKDGGENEDHDSGMDTMFHDTTTATPLHPVRAREEAAEEVHSAKASRPENSALNKTIVTTNMGPTAISTPAASLCLKGLVETSQISKMMLSSSNQPPESPIVRRKSTPSRNSIAVENQR